jgi:hypothetical protein
MAGQWSPAEATSGLAHLEGDDHYQDPEEALAEAPMYLGRGCPFISKARTITMTLRHHRGSVV